MKHSIRVRLILVLAVLISSTLFLCWLMNKTFLSYYYEMNKKDMLGKVYTEVNEIYNGVDGKKEASAEEQEETSLILERLGANKNMNLYIFDIYYNKSYGLVWPEYIYPLNMNEIQSEQLNEKIREYIFESQSGIRGTRDKELLESDKNYALYKVYDERIESYYIEMFGNLDNESYIYIRSNYETMNESVEISNRFLAYMGLFATMLGIIIMFFISKSFTKPILELSGIARRMSDLEFDAKYMVKRQDEIGVLGNSINTLSEKLENTISELKGANNELKTDIENKIQIDEMRKEFLSNVSHELKTPIALIQGYAEGLKENINDDEESRDFYCEVIIDEANKMNKMVKKLLSLNQIEFGNNQIVFERFDLVALIKSVLASTEILFQQKGTILYFEELDPVYVWADEYMIEEVITNYISNALNHVSGSNIIEVKLIKSNEVVRVAVFNSGEPIPEEDLDKIWIKFYKVDKARTREYGGSGIGLSIVKAIMASLNRGCGVINHDSGVEFWFELDTKNE